MPGWGCLNDRVSQFRGAIRVLFECMYTSVTGAIHVTSLDGEQLNLDLSLIAFHPCFWSGRMS